MRDEKQLMLDEIKGKIEESKGFVVARYQDFNASRVREFRDTMAELGGEFEVVRKRIFIKAAKHAGLQFDINQLQGHVGIVFAQKDAVQIAKSMVKYGEENDQMLAVLGGQVEGEQYSAEDLITVAKLPTLAELRASLLGVFEAPMGQTVGVLQAVLTSIIYCIEEQHKSKR